MICAIPQGALTSSADSHLYPRVLEKNLGVELLRLRISSRMPSGCEIDATENEANPDVKMASYVWVQYKKVTQVLAIRF